MAEVEGVLGRQTLEVERNSHPPYGGGDGTAVETQLRQPVQLPGAAFPSGMHLRQQARTPDCRLLSLLPQCGNDTHPGPCPES
jgi:hypothetical protein